MSYGAAVADIEVDKRTGTVVATRVYAALDAGQIVNPALVEAQIMGQVIQAVSPLKEEEVLFDQTGVTSLDWVSYPVLRFAEHPDVVPVVVQRLDEPSTGAGEEVMGATTAAVANAFFDATGVRLRQYPMTPERVKAALAARTWPGRRGGGFRQSQVAAASAAGMSGEQRRQPRRIAACHAAFGADAVDADVAAGRRQPCGVARGVVVVDQAEIERGLARQPQLANGTK